MNFDNFKNQIQNNKTTKIVVIVLIAIVVLLVVLGVLKLTGVTTKIDDKIAEKKIGDTLDKEISTAAVHITPVEAKAYADKLYAAMKGLGTDEDAIYEVFANMTTRSDVLYLIKTFGVKDSKTLNEWLTAELNANERTKLNNILANSNVNYQF